MQRGIGILVVWTRGQVDPKMKGRWGGVGVGVGVERGSKYCCVVGRGGWWYSNGRVTEWVREGAAKREAREENKALPGNLISWRVASRDLRHVYCECLRPRVPEAIKYHVDRRPRTFCPFPEQPG